MEHEIVGPLDFPKNEINPWDIGRPKVDYSPVPFGYDENAFNVSSLPLIHSRRDVEKWMREESWTQHQAASLAIGISPDFFAEYDFDDFGPGMELRFWSTVLYLRKILMVEDNVDSVGSPNHIVDTMVRRGCSVDPCLLSHFFRTNEEKSPSVRFSASSSEALRLPSQRQRYENSSLKIIAALLKMQNKRVSDDLAEQIRKKLEELADGDEKLPLSKQTIFNRLRQAEDIVIK